MKKIKILMLEDNKFDAELIKEKLISHKFDFVSELVETEKDFISAIHNFKPDLILSDYSLPQFTGFEALEIAKKLVPDIPFIMVTGSLSEELAADSIKRGAWDYILKEDLLRLTPAIENAFKLKEEKDKNKRAEEALKKSEAKYRTLFTQIADPIFIFDKETHRFLDCNQAALDMYGYTLKELYNMTPLQLHPTEERSKVKNNINTEDDTSPNCYTHITKGGEAIQVEIHSAPINYEGKEAWISIVRDISERKQMAKKLEESEIRFRELFENMSNGVAVYEAVNDGNDFIFKDFNKTAERIDKIQRNELINQSVLKVFPGVKEFGLFDVFQRVWKTGNPERYPVSLYKDNKIQGWRENYVYKLPTGEIVAVYEDITERKQAEEALKNSEERELIKASKLLEKNLQGKGTGPDEFILNRKDGSRVSVEIRTYPVKIKDETVVLGITRDITERKQAEKLLRESEERYRSVFRNSIMGIYRTTPDGEILMANPALISMLRFNSLEDLQSVNIKTLYCDINDRIKINKSFENEEKIFAFETRLRRKDGSKIDIQESGKAVKDEKGNILYYEGVMEDISIRKAYETEIIEARKKAEKADKLKSEFLAQMSHEVRTPLNVVLNLTQLLEDEIEGLVDDEINEYFPMIRTACGRIIRTIELILNASEIQADTYDLTLSEFDLFTDCLSPLIKESQFAAKLKGLELKQVIKTENRLITADRYSVAQIFSNLIDNAIKYTGQGQVEVGVYRDKKNQLCVDIRDTGIGISEEFLPGLFEVFSQEQHGYSRKYDGVGLGLFLVKNYCRKNNIEIFVKSERGVGSTFTLKFNNS